MPTEPPIACAKCGKAQTDGAMCAGCRAPQVHDDHKERARREPWSLWYRRLPWTNRDGSFGIRRNILQRDPICKRCNRAPSTVADHIYPHKGDWKLFTNLNNLMGVCKPCHDEKTGRESEEARAQRKIQTKA